jgi:hypothetical protein
MPSIMWNPTLTYPDTIATTWGVLEAIALTSDDPTDNGPFNIYIDDLANGTNGVFQDFEGFVAGTLAGVVFNQPGYSGTTSGFMLGSPNDATIVNEAAYSGTKSQRVQWQFATGATNSWIRFNTYNTSVMPNPVVNLDQPISFKILIEPVGSTPTPPARPTLKANAVNSQIILSWVGAHNLQSAVNVNGTYTNVINTAVAPYTNSVAVAPYTNILSGTQRFFRLVN